MGSLRGFGFTFDIEEGRVRNWYVDEEGKMRWSENDELVHPSPSAPPAAQQSGDSA